MGKRCVGTKGPNIEALAELPVTVSPGDGEKGSPPREGENDPKGLDEREPPIRKKSSTNSVRVL